MKIDPTLLLAGYPPPMVQNGVISGGDLYANPFQSPDLGTLIFHLTAAFAPIPSLEQRYNTYDDVDRDLEWDTSVAFFMDWRMFHPCHIGYLWLGNVASLESATPLDSSVFEIAVTAKKSPKEPLLGVKEKEYWVVCVNNYSDGWKVLAQEARFYLLRSKHLSRNSDDLLSVHDLFAGEIELVDVVFPQYPNT